MATSSVAQGSATRSCQITTRPKITRYFIHHEMRDVWYTSDIRFSEDITYLALTGKLFGVLTVMGNLTHWGRNKGAAILKTPFWSWLSCTKIVVFWYTGFSEICSETSNHSNPALVQMIIWQPLSGPICWNIHASFGLKVFMCYNEGRSATGGFNTIC